MGDSPSPLQPLDESEAPDQAVVTPSDSVPITPAELNEEAVPIAQPTGISQISAIIQEGVQYLDERLNALQRGFDQKLKYDEQKDKTIQRLHSELETYRQGLYAQMLRPIALDLIRLYNDLGDYYKTLEVFCLGIEDVTSPKLLRNLALFLDDIEEILRRNGFLIISTAPDTAVQTKYHKLMGTEPTYNPELNNCVAASLKKGLIYQRPEGVEQVLQPEVVKVFRYIPAPDLPTTTESTDAETLNDESLP